MMLICYNSNKADTLLDCLVADVNEYGIPSRVRTDKGLENVQIADYMIEKRGTDRGSIITCEVLTIKELRGFGEMFFKAFLVSFTTPLVLCENPSMYALPKMEDISSLT